MDQTVRAVDQKVVYEFDRFRLDPQLRILLRDGEDTLIRALAFDLLLVLVKNAGQSISVPSLIEQVWGSNGTDSRNFHVTLNAVRNALKDPAASSRFIIRDASGYTFTAEVRLCADTELQQLRSASGFRRHLAFISLACCLYAALFVVGLFLEVAFQFNRFALSVLKIAPIVFGWILLTAILSLLGGRVLTLQNRSTGIVVSSLGFVLAALAQMILITRVLPDSPVTQATFQTYPAQAAYLKDVSQFLLVAVIFLIWPFHFISSLEKEIENGRAQGVLDLLKGKKHAPGPHGGVYPRPWVLVCVLAIIATILLITTAHLLENLRPDPNLNLFIELIYVRGILYLGLGLACLTWYYVTLNSIKRVCLARIA